MIKGTAEPTGISTHDNTRQTSKSMNIVRYVDTKSPMLAREFAAAWCDVSGVARWK